MTRKGTVCVAYDPAIFVEVPRPSASEAPVSAREWAAAVVDDLPWDVDLTAGARANLVEELSLAVPTDADEGPSSVLQYIHLGRPESPYPLVFWLEFLDRPRSRRGIIQELGGVGRDGQCIDEFRTPSLGAGFRVIRTTIVEREPCAAVEYGFGVDDAMVKLSCLTPDVARLEEAVPDLDAFVASIKVNPDDDA